MKRCLFPLLLLATAASGYGALAITDATFSGTFTAGTPESLTGIATLTSITTSEGTFSGLTGATSSNAAGQRLYRVTDPGTDSATVLGLTASDGLLNLTSTSTDFQFGSTFTASTRFFILDATAQAGAVGDPATIVLIDSLGNAVGTYSYGMVAASFGPDIAAIPSASREGAATISLETHAISFSLADFTGTGDFSTATGIRLTNASGLDPTVVGIYTVPEPASLALTALGGLTLAFVRRRR